MAFPSSSGTRAETLESAWGGARATATKVKQMAQQMRAASLAGPVQAQQLLDFLVQLATMRERFTVYAAVPGIGAYAQAQMNDNTLNVAAEFNGMTTAMDNVRNWMIAAFPKNANGYLLARQFDGAGRTTDRAFSTAELADFRTQLDGLIASID